MRKRRSANEHERKELPRAMFAMEERGGRSGRVEGLSGEFVLEKRALSARAF